MLLEKEDLDKIIIPTMIPRQASYLKNPKYSYLAQENQPKQIYLSSASYKSHWTWDFIRQTVKDSFKGEAIIYSTDYQTTIKHNIKTKQQMIQAKNNSGEMGWLMEYCNIYLGGTDNQYYSFDLLNDSQKIPKAWYPRTTEQYFDTTKTNKDGVRIKYKTWFGDIPKVERELRVVCADIATSMSTAKTKNDYTVIKCIRALQNGDKYDRQEVYIESFQGKTMEEQAVRMRELFDDFQGDYIVIDAHNFGTLIFDEFAKVLYSQERECEYEPICCMNRDEYKSRCKNPSAIPIVYAYVGTLSLNDELHKRMKGALMSGKYKTLISHTKCKDEVLNKKKEYTMATPDMKSFYELPYIRSDMLLNEMINLSQEFKDGGKIRLSEPSNGTKDSYMTSGMGNYFISEKESELTQKEDIFDYDISYVLW